ncbi:MAG: gliding motility protein GldN [Bacteroidales bacterium]|nr:gliding motility protein GldN [Bacteroidales bacterium]
MKKTGLLILSALALFFYAGNLNAQVIDEEESTEELDQFYERAVTRKAKKPFEYPYVRDADVIWSRAVWRVVDFREKMNQVFYYPVEEDQGRINMFTMIDKAASAGTIKIYEDDEFKTEIPDWNEFKKKIGTTRTEEIITVDLDGMESVHDSTIYIAMNPMDVKTLRIKERWFVDKQRSVRDVRIVGLALIYFVQRDDEAPQPMPLGWIRFNDPEVRYLLANTEVFNPQNDAERRSYDDIFQKRMFTSYVIKESERFNRSISDYLTGMDALYESDRVEEDLLNVEQDMWEY